MVVDDNIEYRKGIDLTLRMEDFDVWTAANGQEALDELHAVFRAQVLEGLVQARLPDLILADIMMPEMDGYEFFEQVRRNPYLNHIPFIFLTAKGGTDHIRYGKELGSDDYLPKLTANADLLATIRGKLKRDEQRQHIIDELTPDVDLDEPTERRGGFAFIGLTVALLMIGFILGYITAIALAG
jgi:DNA-binding response OmpR family regulator